MSRFPRPKASHYEGYVLVQVLSHGEVLQRFVTEEAAAKLEKGGLDLGCGTCCHPRGVDPDLAEGVATVVGKVVAGKINGEPLSRWLPRVE